MLEKTGIATPELIEKAFPSQDRLEKGAVAVFECFQNIPCNPCYTACKQGAIKKFEDINDLPEIDYDLCTGCGLCVSHCPGLSIMIVDASYSKDEVILKIPYEFLPLPKENDIVKGLDRAGSFISDVRVIKVLNPKSFDRTPIISIVVPKKYMKTIRNIKVGD